MSGANVIGGSQWYRTRIRTLGPLFGLAPMVALGAASKAILWGGNSTRSGLLGLVTGVAAAPGLLVAGAPFADPSRYRLAVVASIPLWVVLGWLSARRATTRTIASWRDFWREMIPLALAVVIGATAALMIAAVLLDESLVV